MIIRLESHQSKELWPNRKRRAKIEEQEASCGIGRPKFRGLGKADHDEQVVGLTVPRRDRYREGNEDGCTLER